MRTSITAQAAPRLPKPDRDPYFNRTAGADQVAPLIAGREIEFMSSDDEPEIVGDYRRRREIIGLERGFQLAGRLGFTLSVISLIAIAVPTLGGIQRAAAPDGFLNRDQTGRILWIALHVSGLVLTTLFALACLGLIKRRRWARLFLTVATTPPIAAAFVYRGFEGASVILVPSIVCLLLLLWRPRGRRYFSEGYGQIIERTPALAVSRETGRAVGTIFLSSLLVVEIANGLLLITIFPID